MTTPIPVLDIATQLADSVFVPNTKRTIIEDKNNPHKVSIKGRLRDVKAPGRVVVVREMMDNLGVAVWAPAGVWYGDILKESTMDDEKLSRFGTDAMTAIADKLSG